MDSNDIKLLREMVRKRRGAVTSKENRIRRNTGIELQGTQDDPRRPPSVVNKYNSRQLNSYLAELNAFMNRGNGFIPDASGSFIKKADWTAYKKAERANNAIARAEFNAVKNIHDPFRNMKIGEAEPLFTPDNKRAQGDIRHRPFSIVDRKPENIKNAAALAKLKKQLEGKLDKGYLPKAIKASRKQANQMLDNAGMSEFRTTMKALSDSQFNVLWNYTGFAGRLGQIGESGGHRSKNTETKNPMSAQEVNNIREDIANILAEARYMRIGRDMSADEAIRYAEGKANVYKSDQTWLQKTNQLADIQKTINKRNPVKKKQ